MSSTPSASEWTTALGAETAGRPTEACPICARPARASWRTINGMSLTRCGRCGFAWFPPSLYDGRVVEAQYVTDSTSPADYYRMTEAHDTRTFAIRMRRVVELTGQSTGRVLDVGCNVGVFLEVARRAGWTAVGVEPNPRAAAVARDRGFEVHEGLFDEALAARVGTFDAVHLGDVIEHVFTPLDFLRRILRTLRPGGLAMVVTPDVDSLLGRLIQIKPDEHLVYFTRDALRRAAEAAGFQGIAVQRWSRRRSIPAMRYGATLAPSTRRLVHFLGLPGVRSVIEHALFRLLRDEVLLTAFRPRPAR